MVRPLVLVLAISVTAVTGAACSSSDSDDSDSAQSSASSGMAAEARTVAMTEVQKHWVKATDGWITARTLGSPYAPDHLLRQARELTIEGVQVIPVTDADRLNGFEFVGNVQFKKVPCREAGDPGLAFDAIAGININRSRGQWTQWVDIKPEDVEVQKVKGQWQVHQDTWLLRGTLPTPADYQNAGVK